MGNLHTWKQVNVNIVIMCVCKSSAGWPVGLVA